METKQQTVQEYIDRMMDYYSSDDFKDNYTVCLLQDRSSCIYQLKRAAEYELDLHLTDRQCDYIIDELAENMYDYLDTYRGYYVGRLCVDSVSFGEQCEDVPEQFKNEEDLKALDWAGFYVDEKQEYMYYNLSDDGILVRVTKELIEKHLDK